MSTASIIRRSATALAAAALCTTPLIAGAQTAAASEPNEAPANAPAPADAAPANAAPDITWEDCPEHVDNPAAQCGRIEVPTYYDAPENGSISVGFIKVPAANQEAKRGAIFGNPGGPGGDAYSYFGTSQFAMPESIVEEFDRIAVQPRGLPGSTPVECENASLTNPLDATLKPGSVVRDACEAHQPGYTASLTTENTARDWEMVRRALGEDRISILGWSYGTYLGSAYATLYPEHTDKVILDSAMSPDLAWSGIISAQEEGYEKGLHDFFQFVADNDDTYHLGKTPLAAYDSWSRKVASEAGITPTALPPAAQIGDLPPGLEFAGQPGADILTGTGELRVTADYLGQKVQHPERTQLTSETLARMREIIPRPGDWDAYAKDVAGIEKMPNPLADILANSTEEEKTQIFQDMATSANMQNLLVCNENAYPADPLAFPEFVWQNWVIQDIFKTAPLQWRTGTICADRAPVTQPIAVNGDKLETAPLLINGTGDPQTPYQFHGDLQQRMGAHLVTVHGPGHGHVGQGNEAVDAIVDKYLRTGYTDATDAPSYFG